MADEINADPFDAPSIVLGDGTKILIATSPRGLEVRYRTAMGSEGSSSLPRAVALAMLGAAEKIALGMADPPPAPPPVEE